MLLLHFIGALLSLPLTAVCTWPSEKYYSEKFSTPKFKITRSGNESESVQHLFLGITASHPPFNGPLIARTNGELIWHGESEPGPTYNFHASTLNNKPVLSYWNGVAFGSHGYGEVKILDSSYRKIQTVCLPENVNNDVVTPKSYPPGQCFIDKHESYITDRNTIVVTTYNVTQTDLRSVGGPKDGWVFDALFFELDLNDNNKVLFRWSALESGVKVSTSKYVSGHRNKLKFGNRVAGDSKSNPWDWFHINSVQPIDGGYLVNSRCTWSFYLVNGKTGAVEHTVEGANGGDFTFTDEIFFSWQHNPRLEKTDGQTLYISLFNNDNIGGLVPYKNASSGYLLAVDKEAKTVGKALFLQDPKLLLDADAEGSYQVLDDGNALLGYGAQPFVQQFDKSGNVIYTAQFGDEYELHRGGLHSYRAYQLPWYGNPAHKPSIVALKQPSNEISVYMSWNGATEHHSWKIVCGRSRKSLDSSREHRVKRSGFETKYSIQEGTANCNYVRVQAMDGNGSVMANSKTVKVTS